MISLCRVAGTNGVIVRCLALDIFPVPLLSLSVLTAGE